MVADVVVIETELTVGAAAKTKSAENKTAAKTAANAKIFFENNRACFLSVILLLKKIRALKITRFFYG